MAISSRLHFSINFWGDGSSTTATVLLATAPFGLSSPSGDPLQPGFTLSTLTPNAIDNLTSSDGHSISASFGLLGDITFTWGTAPALNQSVTVMGYFHF